MVDDLPTLPYRMRSHFHLAIGQFINYRVALKVKEPERQLFLAIPDTTYQRFFQKEFPQIVIQEYQLKLL
ncbi:element excision factor XisH family protein [Moorena producens]|uniref:element excision factor XisH family protein n=1 Tax=Moorena producens TaxID=1155739 RepID=UPI0009F638E4|nr:element excision factor XisH family protein [Moorena producens]